MVKFSCICGFFFFWVLGVECVRGRWTNHVGLLLLSLSLSLKKYQKKINQCQNMASKQLKEKKNYHGKKSLWIMRCSFHSLKLKMSVISWLLHRQCIDLFTWKSCHIFSEKRIESFFLRSCKIKSTKKITKPEQNMKRSRYESCDGVSTIQNWKLLV